MRTVESFPRAVRVVENLWIPMRDGTRLAARMWIPADAERRPVPAVLEYIPYRKRDGTRERDEPIHHYFAGHGYAALRVDLRGTGDSEGLLLDEYLPTEQDDGEDAIAWIAAQPWCTGAVGMLGKSWGGFNALQIAARRPPALRAVISVCSTDDRYADDAHYMGGVLLNENLVWGTLLMGLAAQPPDPELLGERWRAQWQARLEALRPLPARWMRHPRRDAYWRHGSVCEDYGAVRCPVFLVGGWADAYTNAVPRLLAGLSAPCKALVGPWAHVYPHRGTPGPAIGFLQEALAWWAAWLHEGPSARRARAALAAEPALRAWMPAAEGPGGRWVAEPRWPSPRVVGRRLRLVAREGAPDAAHAPGPHALVPEPADGARPTRVGERDRVRHRTPLTAGAAAGAWCRFGHPEEEPGDQRADDAAALCFDGAPLGAGFELLGSPRLQLRVAVDRPAAYVVARLCDVAPDGSSRRVTWGVLDLAAREGPQRAAPVVPGEAMDVVLELGIVAHAFAPGHRVRLALSTASWPLLWPAPEEAELELHPRFCGLELPERPPRAADAELPPFAPPEAAPVPSATDLQVVGSSRHAERDPLTGELHHVVRTEMDARGRVARWRQDDIDLQVGQGIVERFSLREGAPLSARAAVEHVSELRRGAWSVRVVTRTCLTAEADAFRLRASVHAELDDTPCFARTWDELVPRAGAP